MADYNAHGRPTISKMLKDITDQIDHLQVTDPRLENLRYSLYELSIKVEEIEARVKNLERHEATGLQLARVLAVAVFVLVVLYLARYA